MEHALICPQCKAPLTPHRFARQVVCSYCGTTVQLDESSVSTQTFHDSFRSWNSPESYGLTSYTSIGDRHWDVEDCIARGEFSDIYTGRLARWPTELVLLKVLRENRDEACLHREWKTLQSLQFGNVKGVETFIRLIPQPVMCGIAISGAFAGRQVSVFRWASGFRHTFEDVHKAYPQGIPARSSIWVWRRILEVLSFIHASGVVHGAVLPQHLLIQENEHGVRLVGYGHSGRFTEPLEFIQDQDKAFYPQFARSLPKLSAPLDIVMSAGCIVQLLGGDPSTAELPQAIPSQLAVFVRKISLAKPEELISLNAWAIHEELGSLSAQVFGPPSFNPIVLPS